MFVSVHPDDREDFQDTRLFAILSELKDKDQWFLDWPEHPRAVGASPTELRQALSVKIDNLIAAEQQKIKARCLESLHALKAVREANTVRLQQNTGAESTAKLVGAFLVVLVLATVLLTIRESLKVWL